MVVKETDNTFNLAKGGQKRYRPWYIFHGIFIETPDIWKQIVEGGLYKYPRKNISKTANFLPTFG
jgi:hypothetical protein